MPYLLKGVTIRVTPDKKIKPILAELWQDIETGKLPLLFDSSHHLCQGLSPIIQYSHYTKDIAHCEYDLTIQGVTADFFTQMERLVLKGLYKKYDVSDLPHHIELCSQKAWEKVNIEVENQLINRAFTKDYESAVPSEYTKDGKAHCYLYIAVTH